MDHLVASMQRTRLPAAILRASSLTTPFPSIDSSLYHNRRCFHIIPRRSATSLPHSIPAPPPPAPVPAASQPEDRVARKKRQLELLKKGQALRANPSRPATALQKRFWDQVLVKHTPHGLEIFLDERPVRTASKNVLTIPHSKHPLATAIALEWDLLVSSQQALKQHYIPLTSMTSRVVDIQQADMRGETKMREDLIRVVMRHLDTDTLLCWAPEKNVHDVEGPSGVPTESLRAQQIQAANPIIGYLTTHVWPGVQITPVLGTDSILPTKQDRMTIEVIRGWLFGLPPFELAALERAVLASKSLLVAVRLLVEWSEHFASLRETIGMSTERFGIEEAAHACTVEVRWQTSMWGEVEDTHDVDREDVRRQLGSVILMVHGS